MKRYFLLLLILSVVSCQVTETIHFNADGSGIIEVTDVRDENSYMQLAGENYSKEEIFKDSSYVFADYISKYQETFARTQVEDQKVYLRYATVKWHQKKSSFEKEFRSTYSQHFSKASDIADLYKVDNYADNIKNNYALSAEEHYYKVSYDYVGNRFNRIVNITDSIQLKKEFDKIEKYKTHYTGYKLVQNYVLNYHFTRKIKFVSNPNAKISADQKSVTASFLLTHCLQNPEITNLEIVLESE